MRGSLPRSGYPSCPAIFIFALAWLGCEPDASEALPTPPVGASDAAVLAPLDAGRDDSGGQTAPAIGPDAADGAISITGNSDGGRPPVSEDAALEGGPADAARPDAESPGALSPMFPAPGAQGVCADAALRVRFAAPPTLGSSGRLRVFEASGATTPAAELDMAQAMASDVIDGVRLAMPRRAYVDGNEAVFYLPRGALKPGRSYSVTIDAGVLSAPDGKPFTLQDRAAWTFATAEPKPRDPRSFTVALDGSGDFCSIQSAIEAVPTANTSTLVIELARGTYHEIIRWRAKSHVTLKGQDRSGVIIAGVNNEDLNPGTAKRALVGIDESRAVVIEDLTIRNLTPQGGSQAEALRMQNCDQCVVRRASILSLQDTLLWSGRIYAKDCYIEGNVDYVWGTGTAYFDHCELHTKGRKGYIVQARNPASSYGYVFVDCRLTSDSGVQDDILARIDVSTYPASHVAFIGCEMGSHIARSGFLVTGAGSTQGLRFWEYGSTRPGGQPLDVSGRLSSSTQLSSSMAATMRNPSAVLGGWTPPAQ